MMYKKRLFRQLGLLLAVCFLSAGILLSGCESFFALFEEEGSGAGGPSGRSALSAGDDWERVFEAKEVPPEHFFTPAVEKFTKKVKRNPERFIDDLVHVLLEDVDDPFLQVKAIHDWIAYNIDYDFEAFMGKRPMEVRPYAVLERGATVCQGYSDLFRTLCTIADIRCVLLQGYSRGYGWDPYREMDKPEELNHAWNGVEIDGGWYLVDCTWDAGYIGPGNKYVRDYGTGYFCTRLAVFLAEHFPDDPRWQLLEEPYSFEEFHQMPSMQGRCSDLGISLLSDLRAINEVRDRAEIVLKVPEDVYLAAHISQVGPGADPTGYPTFRIRGEETETHLFSFPKPGRYFMAMGAGRILPDGTREPYHPAISAYFEVSAASDVVFPRLDPEFLALGLRVVSPDLPYNPEAAEPVTVVVSGDGAPRGAEKSGDKGSPEPGGTDSAGDSTGIDLDFKLFKADEQDSWNPLKNRTFIQREGNTWTVQASFPASGDFTFTVFKKVETGGGSYELTAIAWFPFESKTAMQEEYPEVYNTDEFSVVKPVTNPLPGGSETAFEVVSRRGRKVFIGTGARIMPLTHDGTGTYTGSFTVNGDKVWLYYLDETADTYMPVAKYSVR